MDSEHQPKLSPIRAFQAYQVFQPTEPHTSLSEYHDYEPNLEFDDSELQTTGLAPLPPELFDISDDLLRRSASDGTIEENFEEELAAPVVYGSDAPAPPLRHNDGVAPKTYSGLLGRTLLRVLSNRRNFANVARNGRRDCTESCPTVSNLSEVLHQGECDAFAVAFRLALSMKKDPLMKDLRKSSNPSQDDDSFSDLSDTGLVEVVGDDEIGRRIIVVSACRLPETKYLDSERLLRYLTFTLDKYVELDYSLVYFHYGLTSKNKPPLSWLWKAYKAFERKYKKNLKALYLVHPTKFIRVVWQMLRPAISVKFGKKMMYVNYLHELQQYIDLDKLCIPQRVLEYDKLLLSKNPKDAAVARHLAEKLKNIPEECDSQTSPKGILPPPTQQFGISLQFIIENNGNVVDYIPPVVRQCVEYLSQPDALETEGIFRRSANLLVIKELMRLCNRGEPISFRDDPHNAAVLLKIFLRDLEEPLLTFELYEEILKFQIWPNSDKLRQVKIIILEKIPVENYKLLKFIFQFLWKVQDRSCLNKMTSGNLAVVFGPNLSWPCKGPMSLQAIGPINAFTEFIIENQKSIFIF